MLFRQINHLASGADEGEICIWDVANPAEPTHFPPLKMMWVLEYDLDLFFLYEETDSASEKAEGSKGKAISIRQCGKYERENMKNGAKDAEAPLRISVFLVASVLKEKSSKLLTEAWGLDDVVKKMGGFSGYGARIRKRVCSCTKDDFLPEQSFKSWGDYARALKETPYRFKDRVLTRSLDQAELEVKARSQHQMKKTLSWWDLIWFGMGAVIGAGIFVLTGLEARDHAGPAVMLSYVVSGVSALLSVFCYTEFAIEIPVAGLHFLILH
ncbi:hypothetical protein F0562_013645 [Nyssa sinensis]|uniref:Amino acid permease/ SLC12A domain-containing protein n=1 Tax=Nyssa sinensis TaxID=561372 RepID=A0A5J4ZN51_9ASTE|nr:hypothetical protein F0562_013645 [Nyssa sinensis]